ncbi:lipopolysaccharide assembly protein LapB [Flavobacterium sp. CS20]|uniref:tetratricopeptide repeat protein n=1 Tax=Flavobacterium sp. CS20 TaxID=2775246 RepID=UPI001B39F506|nr:tetratricopeptide repeat protein [Flavobacterium sp. CS20]QTY27089.1 tetratricopeptide repeat protein [Flavobacterium sp. CS20]
MTVSELKNTAKKYKIEGNFDKSMELYEELWKQEKNEWNGYFLAQVYRKSNNFQKARDLHNQLAQTYPKFKPLKTDKLWLDYSEKIKDWDNSDLVSDANDILSRTNQHDKYEGNIYRKTVLSTVRYLCYKNEHNEAYEWLLKLDQSKISNTGFLYNGQWFPADRKVYFIRLADVLIILGKHIDYIDECFEQLNFSPTKLRQFKSHLIDSITYDDYISRVKLARYIKNFQEEFELREKKNFKKIYNPNKTISVSDLSQYLFCPVSYAINETYEIDANDTWEKDEWLGNRRNFSDRHRYYNKHNDYEKAFDDSDILINDELKKDFDYLFSSKIIVDNVSKSLLQLFTDSQKSIVGAPDYILKANDGKKIVLTEKFSSIHSADSKTPFDSDLVKHFAYLEKFDKMDLNYGYFITWYWELIDIETNTGRIKKKIKITSYRIVKVERTNTNSNKLNNALNRVKSLKTTKSMQIDADRISYANKCFSCSVFSYCNHKTGKFDQINLPYELTEIKEMKNVKPNKPDNGIEDDDLPF